MIAPRPAWQANAEAKACEKCKKLFTLIHRRHHCRGCGKLVCDGCSEHRVVLPASYEYGPSPQRVCDGCYVSVLAVEYELKLDQGKVLPPDYNGIRASLLHRVKSYLALGEGGWTPESDIHGVKVATRSIEGSQVSCIRSKVVIKAPMKKVMEVYGNMQTWKNWNQHVTSRVVEIVDSSSKVINALYDFPVIEKRDSCFFTTTLNGDLEEEFSASARLTVAAMSVEHPMCPPERGVVRAKMLLSLSLLDPIDGDSSTHFTSLIHSDPQGLLPPFVVNLFLVRGAEHLRGMAKYIETLNMT